MRMRCSRHVRHSLVITGERSSTVNTRKNFGRRVPSTATNMLIISSKETTGSSNHSTKAIHQFKKVRVPGMHASRRNYPIDGSSLTYAVPSRFLSGERRQVRQIHLASHELNIILNVHDKLRSVCHVRGSTRACQDESDQQT